MFVFQGLVTAGPLGVNRVRELSCPVGASETHPIVLSREGVRFKCAPHMRRSWCAAGACMGPVWQRWGSAPMAGHGGVTASATAQNARRAIAGPRIARRPERRVQRHSFAPHARFGAGVRARSEQGAVHS